MAKDKEDSELAQRNSDLSAELAKLREQNEALVAKLTETNVRHAIIHNPTAADLETYTDGEFKDSTTGEQFMLKIVKDDLEKKTHWLKNQTHFVHVTEKGFRLRFEKL